MGNSLFSRPGLGGNAALRGTTHFTGGSPLLASRSFAGTNTISQIRGFGFNRFGHPGGWRGGFGGFGRCWNCGFGFGNRFGWGFGGWGWGSPWLGWGFGWDPFWYDPWWNWGWGWSGYSGYPTNNYYINNYNGSDQYAPQDDSSAPPQQQDQYQYQNQDEQDDQGAPSGNWATPNEAQPSGTPGAPSLAVPVLIYMKNGSVMTVRDYWMIDGELHYILMSGVQRSVDLDQVDLARSNAENAKSGVKFMFKSEPSAPSSEAPAPPAAQPDSSKPTPGAQPEART